MKNFFIQQAQAQITNPVLPAYGNQQTAAESGTLLNTIISAVLSFMLILGALLVLLNLVEAGINWIGSGGDSSKVQKARDKILHAVIGIVIMSASLAIWNVVQQFLGIDLDYSRIFPGNNTSQVQTTTTPAPRANTPRSGR